MDTLITDPTDELGAIDMTRAGFVVVPMIAVLPRRSHVSLKALPIWEPGSDSTSVGLDRKEGPLPLASAK